MGAGGTVMIDVRSPDEFTGKILAPPGLSETCQRGGHVSGKVDPGAPGRARPGRDARGGRGAAIEKAERRLGRPRVHG